MKKEHIGHTEIALQNIALMAEHSHAPSIITLSFKRKIQPIFSYSGTVFGTRTRAMMSWLRNASCLRAQFVLLLGDSRPRLFLTGAWLKHCLWMWYTVMSMKARAFNTYLFSGRRSHRPKREAHVRRVCPLFLTHFGSHWVGFTRGPSRVNHPRTEAGCLRTAENPHGRTLTMIHSCNRGGCRSQLEPIACTPEQRRWRVERSVFRSCQTAGGWVCRRRAELLRLGRLIPFNVFFFFHPLLSSRSYLFWPAES